VARAQSTTAICGAVIDRESTSINHADAYVDYLFATGITDDPRWIPTPLRRIYDPRCVLMATASQVPRPPALLEREDELAAIQALVATARERAGRLLVVEGHAGIGKTRLLGEARGAAEMAGLAVLAARGGELEQDFAFGVVRQLFEPLLARAPREERAELMAGAASLAVPLFDDVQLASRREPAGDTSFAMLHGLYWLAANVALRHPTLITVDDLHWADAPSLRWVAYLARRLEGLPLVVAVAARPHEQSREPDLLTDVLADPLAVVLRPGPLRSAGVTALAREAFLHEPDPGFAAACERATGGNPLFLRALLETLVREGVEPTAENASRALATGPEPIARSVFLRLARLPAGASAVARAAAVLGDGVELHRVAALADLDAEAAAEAATSLVRSAILRWEDPVEFIHPIVRAAVYGAIDAKERTRRHRRAGEILLDAGAPVEHAAAHLVRTLPGGDEFVGATLRRAAEHSLAQGAPQAAHAYLRRALAEPPNEDERAELYRLLGIAGLHVNAFEAAQHLGKAFELTDDPVRRGETALLYFGALEYVDRFDLAADVLLRAIDDVDGHDQELRRLLEAVLIECTFWQPELRELGLERIAAAGEETLGDGLGAAALQGALAWHEMCVGTARKRAIAFAERALESGELLRRGLTAGLTATFTLMAADELAEATRIYDEALAEKRRRGDLVHIVPLLLLRSLAALWRGDILGAEEDLRAPEIGLAADVSTTSLYRVGFLVEALVERGKLDEARRTLDAVRSEEQVHAGYRPFYLYARARVLLAAGDVEEALAGFRAVGEFMEGIGIANPAYVPWRSQAALALRLLGREGEAVELAEAELELAHRWGAPRPIGIALRALGLVRSREGEELLREAVEVLAESPARLEHGRALVDLGAALRRGNQRAEARGLVRQGLDLAYRAGATALMQRAQEELAAMGARSRTVLLTGVEALTASERRAARMAAAGMSNKEIAQALFVTVKAVEVHLSSAYRKLGIGSRRDLPGVLASHASDAAVQIG
jgi:DNA-binding CsgD family transcriptional regulator